MKLLLLRFLALIMILATVFTTLISCKPVLEEIISSESDPDSTKGIFSNDYNSTDESESRATEIWETEYPTAQIIR